jgi:hypothetical protein
VRGNLSTRLKQSEWDFSKVRDEELHICAWWEYLKHIDEAVQAIRAHRFLFHQNKQPTRKQWDDSGFTESDYLLFGRLPFMFTEDAEWPSVPWNDLPRQRQDQIVSRYSEHCLEDHPENVSRELWGDLRRMGESVAAATQAAVNPDWIPGRVRSEEPPVDIEYVLLRIDWSMPPENLVQMFRDWITKRRPADAQPDESRGSASSIRRLRTLLKHLGVWRLLGEMYWTDAVVYTREFLPKPIMSHYEHTWRRAFRSAEKKIESLRARLTIEPWLPVDHYLVRAEMLSE